MRKFLTVLLASAPLIAAAFPLGDKTDEAEWWRVRWFPFVSGYRVKDVILNVLITVPIGLAAAMVARSLPTALAVAVVVSAACEWAQVYAPDRFPSGTDVVCNVAGAALGFFVLHAIRSQDTTETPESVTRNVQEED